MPHYITYSYPMSREEPVFEKLDKFDILTVSVPADAVGFQCVDAKSKKEAHAKRKEAKTYFIGTQDQLLTKETLELHQEQNPMAQMTLLSMKSIEEVMKKKYIAAFQIPFTPNWTYVAEGDEVYDRETRRLIYPQPKLDGPK